MKKRKSDTKRRKSKWHKSKSLQTTQLKRPTSMKMLLIKFLTFLIPILIGAYFYYAPKISVDFGVPLEHSNVFSSPFIVGNNGNSPLTNITIDSCLLTNVRATSSTVKKITINNATVSADTIYSEYLSPNSTETFFIDFLTSLAFFPGEIKTFQANIKIYISYKWFYIPYQDSFNFQSYLSNSGNIVWYHVE